MKTNAAAKQQEKKFGFTNLFPVKTEDEAVPPPAPEVEQQAPAPLAPAAAVPQAAAPIAARPVPAVGPHATPVADEPGPTTPTAALAVEMELEDELGTAYKRAEALTDGRKRKRQNMIMRPDYLAALRLLGEYRNSSLSQVNEQAVGAYLELFKDELQKAKEWHAAKGCPPRSSAT